MKRGYENEPPFNVVRGYAVAHAVWPPRLQLELSIVKNKRHINTVAIQLYSNGRGNLFAYFFPPVFKKGNHPYLLTLNESDSLPLMNIARNFPESWFSMNLTFRCVVDAVNHVHLQRLIEYKVMGYTENFIAGASNNPRVSELPQVIKLLRRTILDLWSLSRFGQNATTQLLSRLPSLSKEGGEVLQTSSSSSSSSSLSNVQYISHGQRTSSIWPPRRQFELAISDKRRPVSRVGIRLYPNGLGRIYGYMGPPTGDEPPYHVAFNEPDSHPLTQLAFTFPGSWLSMDLIFPCVVDPSNHVHLLPHLMHYRILGHDKIAIAEGGTSPTPSELPQVINLLRQAILELWSGSPTHSSSSSGDSERRLLSLLPSSESFKVLGMFTIPRRPTYLTASASSTVPSSSVSSSSSSIVSSPLVPNFYHIRRGQNTSSVPMIDTELELERGLLQEQEYHYNVTPTLYNSHPSHPTIGAQHPTIGTQQFPIIINNNTFNVPNITNNPFNNDHNIQFNVTTTAQLYDK